MAYETPEKKSSVGRHNEALLKEIRDRFKYATNQWKDIRDEGDVDMLCVSGRTWDAIAPKAKQSREEHQRPVLSADELGQYVNQAINDVRQNKRAIKVGPEGDGATEQTAELRQNRIRQIEYRSNALEDAYITMYENALQRSYGYLRIVPVLTRSNMRQGPHDAPDPTWFNRELRIMPVPNPNMVTPDPDNLLVDGSDWKYLFYGERWSAKDFAARWPKAEKKSFTFDDVKLYGDWIKGEEALMVCEYWCVKKTRRKLLLLKPAPANAQNPNPQPIALWEDEAERQPSAEQILREEWIEQSTVTQYLTNGVEILEENEWRGSSIPFVPCYGKILYVPKDGGQTTRELHSLVRLAREPQHYYNYMVSTEAEAVGGVSRSQWVGYKGQFEGQVPKWEEANHKPVPFLEANPTTEATGQNILPLPQRQSWDPPIGNLEMAKEAARRMIQSAIGISPLPTSAQRKNQKSGIALQEIEESGQRGSFHFVDHFNAALRRTGTVLDELLPVYEDTEREVTVRRPDDSLALVGINGPDQPSMTTGRHDVTISVGPAFATERDEASAFADTIIGSPLMQMLPPPVALKIVGLAVKLKAVGPIGDEISKAIDPEQGKDQQQGPTPEQVQQMQAMIQELQQKLQQAAQALETDQAKQQAQVEKAKIDAQAQVAIAQLRESTAVAVAKMQHLAKPDQEARVDAVQSELQREHERIIEQMRQDHEREMEALKAQHAADQAARAHRAAIDTEVTRADLQPRNEGPQT